MTGDPGGPSPAPEDAPRPGWWTLAVGYAVIWFALSPLVDWVSSLGSGRPYRWDVVGATFGAVFFGVAMAAWHRWWDRRAARPRR